MGVTIGTYLASGPSGWSVITTSGDSNIIYVANGGVDAPGNGTFANPVATVAYAMVAGNTIGTLGTGIRSGFPDWVLFRKGDTWTEAFGDINLAQIGRSASEPFFVGSYGSGVDGSHPQGTGTGARPLFETPQSAQGIGAHGGSSTNYAAVIGLEFYAYTRDPANGSFTSASNNQSIQGISFGAKMGFLLIEDCKVTYYSTNIVGDNSNAPASRSGPVIIRRNISAFSYDCLTPTPSHAQGFHTVGTDSLLIEENTFDNNGFNQVLTATTAASISHASPAVVTMTNQMLTINNISCVTFNDSGGGVIAGTDYFVFNNNGSTFNIIPSVITNGTTHSNTTVDGIASTALMQAGETVSGSNIQAGTTIVSVDSGVKITISLPATSSATVSLTVSPTVSNTNYLVTSSALSTTGNWRDPGATQFNHGIYLDTDNTSVIVRGNIIAKSSNTGVQGRPGGTYQNNLILQAVQAGFAALIPSSITSNVIMEGITSTSRILGTDAVDYGIGAGFQITDFGDNSICQSNIAAHVISGSPDWAFNISGFGENPTGCVLTNNIIYSWGAANQIQDADSNIISPNQIDGFTESGHIVVSPAYPDPNRTVGSFSASIGLSSTTDGFLAAALGQSKDNWNQTLTANAVNTYIRQGFGLDIVVTQSVLLGQAML